MVKKLRDDTADNSDADVVLEWAEEARTRKSIKRGKYKTMNGVPCKTD